MYAVTGKHRISLVMIILLMCLTVLSTEDASAVTETGRKDYKITDGVSESRVFAQDESGDSLRINILTIDKGAAIGIVGTYGGYYSAGSNRHDRSKQASKWNKKNWKCEELLSQVAEYNSISDKEGQVIAASNADHFTKKGAPYGNLILEGNILYQTDEEPFFAVLKNGSNVIRKGGSSVGDVEYAVGGSYILLHKGKVLITRKATKEYGPSMGLTKQPRQAIGIMKDHSVILVNIEGRTPASAGITLFETAQLMKDLGCMEALNLDGGGSADFLTRRHDGKGLKYRNLTLEGYRRNISSGLLFVKKDTDAVPGEKAVNNSVSRDKAAEILAFGNSDAKKVSSADNKRGLCMINGKVHCYDENGKNYSGSLKVGAFKYYFSDGKYTGSSDKNAGGIYMGYCGAKDRKKGLVYIYHKKDKVLNVGMNPFINIPTEMIDWDNLTRVPWYSLRSVIEDVYIGNGVKNVGDLFLCIPDDDNFDGTRPKPSSVKYVKIDKTTKQIGFRAFYNTKVENEMKEKYGMKTDEEDRPEGYRNFADVIETFL